METSDFNDFGIDAAVITVQSASSDAALKFMPTFTAPSNYQDATKIRKYVEGKAISFLEKAALDAMTAEIKVVGFLPIIGETTEYFCFEPLVGGDLLTNITNDSPSLYARFFDSEENLLGSVVDRLGRTERLLGPSLNSFHLPMLIRRCLRYGLSVPARFLPRPRYFNSYDCFDFCEAWALGKSEDKYVSLENLIQFFFPKIDSGDLPLALTDSTTFVHRFRKDSFKALSDLALLLELSREIAPKLYIVRNHPIPV